MKILFIYTNIGGFHEDTYSFGLASIVSVTIEHGHKAEVVLVNRESDYDDVYKVFKQFDPDVIGFSSVSSQFNFVKKIAENLKSIDSDKIIAVGGIHPTIYPECVLESDYIDLVFIGESEESFIDFLQLLEKGEPYKNCDNVAYNDRGLLKRNKCKSMVDDLDSFPFPDRDIYPFLETIEKTGYAPFHFSRGCPFPCTYCSNHAIARSQGRKKSSARFPSAEYCIDEIQYTLKKFPNINRIGIVDDIFGLNKRWRNAFLKTYKEKINIPFFCLLRADVVNEEFVKALKEAGCYSISFGVESGNDYVRNEIMERDMLESKIIRAFDLCKKYNIETNALNIIGVPGETEKMLWDTINLNRKIKPANSSVNIFYPYKGTVLGDQCFQNGLVNQEKFNSFSNERRETVLQYDKLWVDKLSYYYENWDDLVYTHSYLRKFRKKLSNIKLLKSMYKYGKNYLNKVSIMFI